MQNSPKCAGRLHPKSHCGRQAWCGDLLTSITYYRRINRRWRNADVRQIIQSVIREDTTEQLDSAFEEIAGVISLRSARGLSTGGSLNQILAAITAERNARPTSA